MTPVVVLWRLIALMASSREAEGGMVMAVLLIVRVWGTSRAMAALRITSASGVCFTLCVS
ncbi:hypothetical protein ASF60_23070 [Methylobacterium sp. Leaf113]|nr:hypothetical protein ASF60_23070 [Methylobacterium sp. Leaf113]